MKEKSYYSKICKNLYILAHKFRQCKLIAKPYEYTVEYGQKNNFLNFFLKSCHVDLHSSLFQQKSFS